MANPGQGFPACGIHGFRHGLGTLLLDMQECLVAMADAQAHPQGDRFQCGGRQQPLGQFRAGLQDPQVGQANQQGRATHQQGGQEKQPAAIQLPVPAGVAQNQQDKCGQADRWQS